VVILPQALWGVQAIREEDQEKLSEKIVKAYRSNCLAHRRTIGIFASWTREDERVCVHWRVCFMLSVVAWSHDGIGRGWVCGYPIAAGFAREAVMPVMGVV
jgi:hypothetical protein